MVIPSRRVGTRTLFPNCSTWWQTNWELAGAAEKVEKGLKPFLEGTFRGLTAQDVELLDEPFRVWETCTDIKRKQGSRGSKWQVDWMLDLLDYALLLSDIPGVDMVQFRNRMRNLIRHIWRCRLEQARSLFENDIAMLVAWAEVVETELLAPDLLSFGWSGGDPSFNELWEMFHLLEIYDDLPVSALKESKFALTMRKIITAPTMPIPETGEDYRQWTGLLVKRWAMAASTLSQKEREEAGLDIDEVVEVAAGRPVVRKERGIVHRPEELGDVMRRIPEAAANGDIQLFNQLVGQIEGWDVVQGEAWGLTTNFTKKLREARDTMKTKCQELSADSIARIERVLDTYTYNRRYMSDPDRQRFTYYHLSATRAPIHIHFVDLSAGNSPAGGSYLSYNHGRMDFRTWAPITLPCSLDNPLHETLQRFFARANAENRHPLMPLSYFALRAVRDAPSYHVTWNVQLGKFTQGRLTDFFEEVEGADTIWYVRGEYNFSTGVAEFRPPVSKRALPPSCVPPPAHWVAPAVAAVAGTGCAWVHVPTLAFVGNGCDIWPSARYPPVIASYVYMPASWDALGRENGLHARAPTTTDRTPVKLRPPLTPGQARALVGLTVQYAEDPTTTPSASKRQKKKKKGGAQRTGPDGRPVTNWQRVFCAHVWGFDEELMLLKAFEHGDMSTEECKTFLVGEGKKSDLPDDLPKDYPDTLKAFTPMWIGAVELPTEPELPAPPAPVQAPPATRTPKESVSDRRLNRILDAAPREFAVGIGGDCTILVGEIGVHTVDSGFIAEVDNCKPGIWASCIADVQAGEVFMIGGCWMREGTIDLGQAVEAFAVVGAESASMQGLEWKEVDVAAVDGGSLAVLAKGYLRPEAIRALEGKEEGEEMEVDDFAELVVLTGYEFDGKSYIPGGISSYTGGDGGFPIYAAYDSEGRVIAVKVAELTEDLA